MSEPLAREPSRGLATPAGRWTGRGLWIATTGLCLGLLLNTALTIYDLTHWEMFYGGESDSASGGLAALLAEQVGYAQIVLAPIVLALLLWGTGRANDGSAGWRGVLGLVCGGFLFCYANWFSTRPRQDRTGPELGWVHDGSSPGWVRFVDVVAPSLVVGTALLAAVLLLLQADHGRRRGATT